LTRDPRFLATAIDAALAAGRIHRRYFRQPLEIGKKGPIDLVTAADLEVERDFRARIGATFPDHDVLGEEATAPEPSRGASHRWIIDPVDGTTNFAHGLALFCVSIALEIDGALALGVVYDPIGEELFTTERGEGARLNGARLRVSSRATMIDAMLCTGFPYTVREARVDQVRVFGEFLGEARAVRRLGSAALDLAYVAAGRLDGFWEGQLHPWDVAAGVLLVEEAGGRVTNYSGGPLDLMQPQIAASNGLIHGQMIEIIARR
jgi:myo-inositol-1(or 4)-monophosphatase